MEIRNFCIIAHIDAGKSTLADRFLEICQAVPKEKLQPQLLDSLALERERGITIKLAPVRLSYTLNSVNYILNLIDTPGHVDFSYEVSRSLAAVEGAVLLVDATQGIQAQTLSHGLEALEQNLILIPVINKIDLPNADIPMCQQQLQETFGFAKEEIILASGKTGEGVEKILEAIVHRIPPPKRNLDQPLRALIFDSFFDNFKGVVAEVRIVEGMTPPSGAPLLFLGTQAQGQILEVGYFSPSLTPTQNLKAGEIGYVATGIKQADLVRVGDTITTPLIFQNGQWKEDREIRKKVVALPGYKQVKPMVYVGLYPIEQGDYLELKEALSRFKLTDPAFTYEPEHSVALGAGFRCGFLGLLHAEVVQERLSEEYQVDLIATAPSVEYRLGDRVIHNPSEIEMGMDLKQLQEPWVKVEIITPQNYIGAIIELLQDKGGKLVDMIHYGTQVQLRYEMPLSEMITDFYDRLKSVSSGYASLDWEFLEFRPVRAVKVDILVAGQKVDALAMIVHEDKAESMGRRMVEKLKEVLPRQNFEIAIQAAVGGKIIAREDIKPYRKDVTAKLYGGDRTRKDKLLEKQKKGKKRMKMIGRVEIPQEAFLSILKS